MRIVSWFSCGAASAVATKLALDAHMASGSNDEFVVATIYLKDEHPDSERFKRDVEKWLGVEMLILKDEKYGASVDTVIEKTRYMAGVNGGRCTAELKKRVRKEWQRFDDRHVFGFDVNEAHRVDQILDAESDIDIWAPLVDAGLTKADCFNIIQDAGIELPAMYKIGYHNNNCIGCLKANGAGYWNKIRKDFPSVFATRSKQEELLNVSLTRIHSNTMRKKHQQALDAMDASNYQPKVDSRGYMRIPLRFLPEDAGSFKDLDIGSCGFVCERKG